MRVVPTLVWNLEGDSVEALDARLLPLLHAIATSASLAAAVVDCRISYRAAWGLLREYQRKLGEPLVLLERGRGASLTPSGERLLGAERAAARRLARILPGLAAEIGSTPRKEEHAAPQQLRVAASHDLVLAALAAALHAGSQLSLEIAFMGSLHALKEFAEGRAEVAGFHVPIAGSDDGDRALMLRDLRARRDRLIRFVDRDQGLILPHGNPAQVRSFRDIAARQLRFINRQRGSGTRLLIDQRIAGEGIKGPEIAGYDSIVFVDADITVARVTMAPVSESDLCPALTHASTPPEIVALARSLFGFAGTALLCRLPVDDLSSGEGLSRLATESAALAIYELRHWSEHYLD